MKYRSDKDFKATAVGFKDTVIIALKSYRLLIMINQSEDTPLVVALKGLHRHLQS